MRKYWLVLILLIIFLISILFFLLNLPKESTQETPPKIGEVIQVFGELTCLPKKNKDGPQTLECALGLKADSGSYYALHDREQEFLTNIATGERIFVQGKVFNAPDSKYDVIGVIELKSVKKISN